MYNVFYIYMQIHVVVVVAISSTHNKYPSMYVNAKYNCLHHTTLSEGNARKYDRSHSNLEGNADRKRKYVEASDDMQLEYGLGQVVVGSFASSGKRHVRQEPSASLRISRHKADRMRSNL